MMVLFSSLKHIQFNVAEDNNLFQKEKLCKIHSLNKNNKVNTILLSKNINQLHINLLKSILNLLSNLVMNPL